MRVYRVFALWDENFRFKHQTDLPVRRMEEGNWAASDERKELHCQTLPRYVMRIPLKLHFSSSSRRERPWSHFGCQKHAGIRFCFSTLASLPHSLIYCLPEPSRPLGFPPFQDSSSGRQLPASGCLTGLSVPAVEWNPIAGSLHKQSQNQITTKVRLANCYVTSPVGQEAPPAPFILCIHGLTTMCHLPSSRRVMQGGNHKPYGRA